MQASAFPHRFGPAARIVVRSSLALTLPLLGAASLHLARAAAPASVDVKVLATGPASPVAAGSRGEMSLRIDPPEGVHINRYPPIVLKLQAPPGIILDSGELRQGSDELIEDPDEAAFKHLEPIKIGFAVAPGAVTGKNQVSGKLKFTYCVARSGYCAPVNRDVVFDVAIIPPRTN